jgi:hypothetical protein
VPEGLAELIDVLGRSLLFLTWDANRRALEGAEPDVVIRPQLPPGLLPLSGFGRVGEAIAAGERAAEEALPQVVELLRRSEGLGGREGQDP